MDLKIFNIILALIPVIGAIITAFIIPYIKEKIGTEKLAKYEYWAEKAVKAAEMLFDATQGTDKKAYAVEMLNTIFNSKKTVITAEQINALIEASVQALKLEEKSVE